MFGTYIGKNQMLVKTVYNGMLKIASEDLSLMPILVSTGAMELPLTKYLIKHIKPGMTVVDVGTNVGYFTVLLGMLVGDDGKVYGFEANHEVFATLKENLAINWISHRVTLHNKAVYSENTTISFHVSEIFQGDSSILVRPDRENISDSIKTMDIEAVTLNEVLADVESIDLLKIDIEGGEYHAFLGMSKLLENKKIKTLAFEWNKVMLGNETPLFINLLRNLLNQHGASIYGLDGEGNLILTNLDTITSTNFYPFAMIDFS